jgi:hypothetical protein
MNTLPQEIINYIFEFDNTYKEIFDNILKSRFQIYKMKSNQIYYIFDYFSKTAFSTDSLIKPSWFTTHHTHTNKNKNHEYYFNTFKKNILLKHNCIPVSEKLDFDIYNIKFPYL